MGVPPSYHPFLIGIFPYKPSILGYPHLWKPPFQHISTPETAPLLQDWTPALDPRWTPFLGKRTLAAKAAGISRYISIYCRSQEKHVRQGKSNGMILTSKKHQKALSWRIRITEKDWKDNVQSVSHSLNISKDFHHQHLTWLSSLSAPHEVSPKSSIVKQPSGSNDSFLRCKHSSVHEEEQNGR